jgi:hypothetical protein
MTPAFRKDLISRETVRMDKPAFVAMAFWVIFGSSAIALRIKSTLVFYGIFYANIYAIFSVAQIFQCHYKGLLRRAEYRGGIFWILLNNFSQAAAAALHQFQSAEQFADNRVAPD